MSKTSDRYLERAQRAMAKIAAQFDTEKAAEKGKDSGHVWKKDDVVEFQYLITDSILKGRRGKVWRQDEGSGMIHIRIEGERVEGRLHFPVPSERHLKLVQSAPAKAPRAADVSEQAAAVEASEEGATA